MRLVACPDCHRQYDVTHVVQEFVACSCGASIANRPQTPVDKPIHRCGSCGASVTGDTEVCAYCGGSLVRDEEALSTICPECFARNAEHSRFCTACGVAFDPQPLVEGRELPCPCCGGLMPVRSIGELPTNECPSCNGLWVPGDHFETLVNRAVDSLRKRTPGERERLAPRRVGGNPVARGVHYRKCPVCEAFMHRRNFRRSSGVIIDRCHDHGTWLDADELEEIAGFIVDHGGDATPTRDEERKTRAVAHEFHRLAHAGRLESNRGAGGFGRSALDLIISLLD